MTTWTLTNLEKNKAIDKEMWVKKDKKIIISNIYRQVVFYCESDDRPDVDLKNPNGFTGGLDWNFDELGIQSGNHFDFPNGMSEEEQTRMMNLLTDESRFDEDNIDGWVLSDQRLTLYGSLQLTDEDTGKTYNANSELDENQLSRIKKLSGLV